jgi:hypothetical protein
VTPPSAGVVAALGARAAETPEEPWLFHPDGWDWRWRSWGQVADQVARGAAAVRRSPPELRRVGCPERLDPDAVAAVLAVVAAGRTAVPGGAGEVAFPACRSRLDRWRPEVLEPASPAGAVEVEDGETLTEVDLAAGAGSLAALLPEPLGPRSGARPILCAAPDLPLRVRWTLLAWSVQHAAAWALEPDPDAFLGAVLWVRPTVVVAGPGDLERLAAALGERRHRRHHRLRAVVVAQEGAPGAGIWQDLGVPVLFGPSPPRPPSPLPPSARTQGEGGERQEEGSSGVGGGAPLPGRAWRVGRERGRG